MNRNLASAVALSILFAAGAAQADDITVDPVTFHSTRTRAEVQAELAQFKKAGVNPWSKAYNPLRNFEFKRTRAEVAAEFVNAREEVAARSGEDSGAVYMSRRARPTSTQETVAAY